MLLPDLRIKNYRLFKEFEIEQLARVTLIAGRNNTGKSSLLEAAHLLADENVPSALRDVLRIRGEYGEKGIVSPLFYGYRLSFGATVRIASEERYVKFSIPDREEMEKWLDEESQLYENEEQVLLMRIEPSEGKSQPFPLQGKDGAIDRRSLRSALRRYDGYQRSFLLEGTASLYGGNRFEELKKLWDKISLTPQANDIVEVLKIIEPKVTGIDFLRAENNVKVLLEGEERPVLIGSLGDGMRHLLMIALPLTSARDGVLLIDEIDTGLHYTVLIDLWRMIFTVAERLNVQVLATTHSWDCIAAFNHAWNKVQESEGLFLRLDWKREYIQPILYTREELGIAVKQRIEVR
jgi:predicted ATPase